ncbi:MAG: T9SS type A sorting domain-containing protein [Calditrichaceae bacterium]|nr:T9SS type A sorting domain-containing protein [Calditrichaceae bacterium]MBN2707856.1 T9SS type A sorting domain-containing protein [Calditrichaceae bacterium]RQV94228.1 MAG: T9SS C-terminal target domain-containing protein [Calditrichota bacterium]
MKIIYKLLILIVLILSNLSFAQNMEFTNEVLIDLPGYNQNFDLSPNDVFGFEDIFITWENICDGAYSIYIKQLSPVESEPLLIHQADKIPNINPTVGYIDDSLFIAWQAKQDKHWQIVGKKYKNGNLGDLIRITQDTLDNTDPSMGYSKLVWAAEGKIKLKYFTYHDTTAQIYGTDTNSSPDILNEDFFNPYYTHIVFEQGIFPNTVIIELNINYNYEGEIVSVNYHAISDSTGNRNPGFSCEGLIHYEAFDQGYWKGIIAHYYFSGDTIHPGCFNVNNPTYFSYPVVIKRNTDYTPFFVCFDSDSIKNNREIFVIPENYNYSAPLCQNISKLDGCDTLSVIVITESENDTSYVNIIWQHNSDEGSQIWRAYMVFNPHWGAIKRQSMYPDHFTLLQNYPNPFNSETSIQFSIPSAKNVTIKIFDINGRLVETPVDKIYPKGNHCFKWQAGNYATGIYYYQFYIDHKLAETRKMLLIK